MMYLINCALQTPGHDYGPFREAIAEAKGIQATESAWLVDVAPPLENVNGAVLSHLAPSDRVVIVELGSTRWAATNLLDGAGPWLQARQV